MAIAYIALGANLGDAALSLREALAAVAALPDTRVTATSAFYRTAPVGLAEQPDFVNAATRLETALPPEALLAHLLDIEDRFGRVRQQANGPRTLDLDVLLYDDLVLDTPRLTLPHPRMHLRAFVLWPLADISPELDIPGRGTLAAWLPAVANQGIARL